MHTGSLFSEANDSDATALARATMRVKNAIPQAAMDFSVALGQLERQLVRGKFHVRPSSRHS